MKAVQDLLVAVTERLEALARANAVVGEPISLGDRHVVPLCELGVGLGVGGGVGEAEGAEGAPGSGKGRGGGAGGGARVRPVAFVVVEDGRVRLESLER